MTREVILEALRRSGATIEGEEASVASHITKQDFMELGLSGGPDAAQKRQALLKKLEFPEHMSANAMLQALDMLYGLDELRGIVESMEKKNG